MKRFGPIVIVASVVLATLGAAPAGAATQTAAAFAAACSSATTAGPAFALVVSGDLTVSGGTGTFTGACSVNLQTPGARLLFSNVTLGGPGNFFVTASTGSVVEASGSTVAVGGGVLWGTGDGGTIKVTNSTISGDSQVLLNAATFGSDGSVVVSGSKLRSAGQLVVDASCQEPAPNPATNCGSGAGARGKITVNSTRFEGASARVFTGTNGKTTVSGSTFPNPPATVLVHAGPGGSCISSNNTPAVPCS